jgi:CubicO group peptidase (beta-lactamase class C family)
MKVLVKPSIICFILLLPKFLLGQTRDEATSRIDAVDRFLVQLQSMNKFNGTLLVAHNDSILLNKGYGPQSVEPRIENEPDTIFRAYSITKIFTATAVFRLIEQQKLDLDDRLSEFFPDVTDADKITIEHLLTHSSGLFDVTRNPVNKVNGEKLDEVLTALQSKPLDFEPGTAWSYCNTGYFLLGHIIAKTTGKTYYQAIDELILKPSDMTHSGFNFEDLPTSQRAIGYRAIQKDKAIPAKPLKSAEPYSAGALHSTTADLFQFTQAIRHRKLLSDETFALMCDHRGRNPDYAFGLELKAGGLDGFIGHSGGAPGFRTVMAFQDKGPFTLILLDNHESVDLRFVATTVVEQLKGKPVQLPTEAPSSPETRNACVGLYELEDFPAKFLNINEIDGRLAIAFFGEAPCTLFCEGDSRFKQIETTASLGFSTKVDDMFTTLAIQRDGKTIKAKRSTASWGIIGDATSVGWDSKQDIVMAETSPRTNVWIAKHVELKSGNIKFRYGNDWQMNYGDDNNDGVLEPFGKNIEVDAGVYDVQLDLSNDEARLLLSTSQ